MIPTILKVLSEYQALSQVLYFHYLILIFKVALESQYYFLIL